MTTEASTAYRRAPRQDRSRSTVDAIFEAASRLLDDAGLEAATTQRIAHVAGVSIGSLYQYFPRKEALFGALTERAMETDLLRVRAAVDRTRDLPFEDAMREVVASVLTFALERPRLFCWMLRYLPQLGLTPAVEKLERSLAEEGRRMLELHREELGDLDFDLLAMGGVGAMRGAMLTVARERPEVIEDRERTLELMVDIALGAMRAHRSRARR